MVPPLPTEILLLFFSYFDLKSLIASLAVCRRWRELIPESDIFPPRLALLELYLKVVASPLFSNTRTWSLKNLRHFDREEYVAKLLNQHNYIPEEFRIWILEWPARAVFGCLWPGLPCVEFTTYARKVEFIKGIHWLGSLPPKVSTMTWDTGETQICVPGLLISSDSMYTWLLLDDREELRDKVMMLFDTDDVFELGPDGPWNIIVHLNWIEYLKVLWRRMEREAHFEAFGLLRLPDTDPCPVLRRVPKYPMAPWIKNPEPQS